MDKRVSILVSSAGRRVALIECFRESATALGLRPHIIAIDAGPELSAACQVADQSYRAPPVVSDEFIGFVERLATDHAVQLIVPTIDTELIAYSMAKERLFGAGVHVNVSSVDFVRVARDKERTACALEEAGLQVPQTIGLSAFLRERPDWKFPLLMKPRDGSSSVGIKVLRDEDDLALPPREPERYLVQQLLKGIEYTVNVFANQYGNLKCVIPHRRTEVRAGEVSKGQTERMPVFDAVADRMIKHLPPCRGAFCFQSIVDDDGRGVIFEINARFGGGYPLAHRAGAKFTTWLLEEATGRTCSASNNWQSGLTMLRYDAAVFHQG